jgi:hypothetical protein
VVVLGSILLFLPGAVYGASGGITVTASVNGHPLAGSSATHPVRLSPTRAATVFVRVTDGTSRPVDVRAVDLQGQVVGLTFFAFDTSVNFKVKAHSSSTLGFALDLTALKGEASGLIPGSLSVLGSQDEVVASEEMVSDVRGSIVSVYGLFGLGLLVLTLLALLAVLWAVARQKLPANRFRRALRFLVPGVGVGLVLVFSLSALRVWLPSNGHWLTMFLVFAVAFFALGYLTPTPLGSDDDEDEDEDDDDENQAHQGESSGEASEKRTVAGADTVRIPGTAPGSVR